MNMLRGVGRTKKVCALRPFLSASRPSLCIARRFFSSLSPSQPSPRPAHVGGVRDLSPASISVEWAKSFDGALKAAEGWQGDAVFVEQPADEHFNAETFQNNRCRLVKAKPEPESPVVEPSSEELFVKSALKKAKEHERVAFVVKGTDFAALSRALTTCHNALYDYNVFRESNKDLKTKQLQVIVYRSDPIPEVSEFASALARGYGLARDMVNSPPNYLTPTAIASVGERIASEFPESVSLKVLDEADCRARGMGAYLGVAQGSDHSPKFVHLTLRIGGGSGEAENIALIGKGLTFDSGGYNIKSAASSIELMKFDMGGSAAVLGAIYSLAHLLPLLQPTRPFNVHVIVAACENMVSAKAVRPGDILTASNGMTIEITNTDAEGRLTLADALVYAENEIRATTIVDIATLTGAVTVALGDKVTGYYSDSRTLAAKVRDSAREAGEKMWEMPLLHEYKSQLDSSVADIKNASDGRLGGSIIATTFLRQFVKTREWVHLDIAGTAWDKKSAGGTGHGVGTLVSLVRRLVEGKS